MEKIVEYGVNNLHKAQVLAYGLFGCFLTKNRSFLYKKLSNFYFFRKLHPHSPIEYMKDLSLSEEDYLKTIYQLSALTHFKEGVGTNEIAQKISISAASVSDMLRKLAQKGFINYVKYQGVTLTEAGKQHAVSTIRKHRLWETFLVEKLRFRWDEVHEIAEQLEHIQSPLLINRLDEFLEFPAFDPHGDPIPNEDGEFKQMSRITLQEAPIGAPLRVIGVEQDSTTFLQFLNKIKVNIDTVLRVLERIDYDASLEIEIEGQKTLMISREVSENIYVMEDARS